MNVGDTVVHHRLGIGVVETLEDDRIIGYPVRIVFGDHPAWFTTEGKSNIYDYCPSITITNEETTK